MTARLLSMSEVPGAGLRDALRMLMVAGQPWQLVVDARGCRPGTLNRFALLLRLRRQARRRGGDLALVVDDVLRRRLIAAGLQHWLPLAGSVEQARRLVRDSAARHASARPHAGPDGEGAVRDLRSQARSAAAERMTPRPDRVLARSGDASTASPGEVQ